MVPPTKDFTQLKTTDNEEQEIIISKQESSFKIVHVILIITLLMITGANVYVNYFIDQSDEVVDEPNDSIQKGELQIIKLLSQAQQADAIKYAFLLSNKVQQRISLGEPREKQRLIRAVVFEKQNSKSPHCIFTNGVSIISSKTTQAAFNLLSLPNTQKWIVFLPNADIICDDRIKKLTQKLGSSYSVQKHDLKMDSDYQFITNLTDNCQSVVFLQNTFLIDPQNAKTLIENADKLESDLKDGYVGYSTKGTEIKKKSPNQTQHISIPLTDLQTTDLYSLDEQKFNQHIYIFDAKLLGLITPINFIHFNKYTIQQIIISPILVLTQNSALLVPLGPFVYTSEDVIVNFKQFALQQPEKPKGKSFCIVSYPSNPNKNSLSEFTEYLKAISEINFEQFDVTLIPHFVYNFEQKQGLKSYYEQIKGFQGKKHSSRIRLRTKQLSAVSSLSVYESVHNYCPNSSIVISSRQNIALDKQILKSISQNLNEKDHYYQFKQKSQKKDDSALSPSKRFYVDKFIQEHSKVQIFKSDIMKMVNVWVLKKNENSFYESEASFVVPILEMSGENVKIIEGSPATSQSRLITETQKQEMGILNKYSKWGQIKNNILTPIQFNSLTNLNLRRDALNQIPKIIHQIWFKDQIIPQNTQKLISTIKTVNKQYEYRLWKKENMTLTNFPMSYGLVASALEYEWATKISYHLWVQALFSYEILYNSGGIYVNMNIQANKPFDDFLKYNIFFAGQDFQRGDYSSPTSFNRQILGAKRHSYHLRFLLTEIITERRLNLNIGDYEAVVGGGAIRVAFNPSQVYTNIGFGFYLMNSDGFGQVLCDEGCEKFQQSYVQIHPL